MSKQVKRVIDVVLLIGAVIAMIYLGSVLVAGCNTINGAGKDLQAISEKYVEK
jgi:predicted small secreted protein